MATPITGSAVLDLIKNRRTYYALSDELVVSKDRIQEIVKELLLHIPTPYNCQPLRVVVLFDEHHKKLWDISTEIMKDVIPKMFWENGVSDKFVQFKSSAATILFYEDQSVVKSMEEQFAFVKDKWPLWTNQCDAMLQFATWTALEAEGLGCNLQHYNPDVDAKIAAEFNIPESWKLNAQMVLGGRKEGPGPKDFAPIETRYKVFGA